MKRPLLCAAAFCLATATTASAGALEDPVVEAPVIVEDMQATSSMPGRTFVILAALVVAVTAATSAK